MHLKPKIHATISRKRRKRKIKNSAFSIRDWYLNVSSLLKQWVLVRQRRLIFISHVSVYCHGRLILSYA